MGLAPFPAGTRGCQVLTEGRGAGSAAIGWCCPPEHGKVPRAAIHPSGLCGYRHLLPHASGSSSCPEGLGGHWQWGEAGPLA